MCAVLSYGVIGSAAIQLTKEPPALGHAGDHLWGVCAELIFLVVSV